MLRKVFIVSAVVFSTVVLLWGVYLFSFGKSTTEVAKTPVAEKNEPNLSGSIRVAVESPVVSPTISSDKKSIFYVHKDSGNIYRLNLSDGTKTLVIQKETPSPLAAAWSRNTDYAIIKSAGPVGANFQLFSLSSQEPIALKGGIEYLIWDDVSDRIFYTYQNGAAFTLNSADMNGSEWKEIASLDQPIILSSIAQSTMISYWNAPTNTASSALMTISPSGGEAKEIFSGKNGANYLWSPRGDKAVVSWSKETGTSDMALAVINSDGGEYHDIVLPTLVSKCVWSQDSVHLYCALPGSLPSGAVMPDDYRQRKIFTKDTFWKVNTKTGEKQRVVGLNEIDGAYDASDLILSPDESHLYFVERGSGFLYAIDMR